MSIISAACVNVRTLVDGTLRITVDVEPTDAQAAFALFGRPGAPMAIAALVQGHAAVQELDHFADANKMVVRGHAAAQEPDPEPPPAQAPKGGALARLAGQLCQDEEFQEWLAGHQGAAWDACITSPLPDDDEMAAAVVRELCGIKSRAELDHNPVAAELFHVRIREPFVARRRA